MRKNGFNKFSKRKKKVEARNFCVVSLDPEDQNLFWVLTEVLFGPGWFSKSS